MIKRSLAISVAVVSLVSAWASHGAILDLWTFNNAGTPLTPDTGTATMGLQWGGTLLTPGSTFAPDNGVSGHALQTTTGAGVGGFYLSVNLSAVTGPFQITYDGQSGEVGAVSQTWRYSYDAGANWFTPGTQPGTLGTGGWSQYSVLFNDSNLNSQPHVVQFELDLPTGNKGDFDNVQLAAVPEPINVALVVFGICAAGVGVGRRAYSWAKA